MTSIGLVGAGLVGSLLGLMLARRGFDVVIYERRPDMRKEKISAGRSINLAISTRGINALSLVGLDQEVLSQAIPMRGRMIHSQQGELAFQPYGMSDNEYINSISRATLNKILMSRAEESGRVRIEFSTKVADIDFDNCKLSLVDERNGEQRTAKHDLVIGTDGSASAIRHAMLKLPEHSSSDHVLDYGYKELTILPGADGAFKLERNALHIWPRGTFMLIALPNFEGSFTCTLFLPFEGELSFENLKTPEQITEFFTQQFPDSVPLIEDLVGTFQGNPTGHMVTVKCYPWHVGGTALLMGDAAHGIVPFFGQGMNCGFEDCAVFDRCLSQETSSTIDWKNLFTRFGAMRKDNTDAIADMAVENFVEMRDKVADPRFVMHKAAEKVLQNEFPDKYISRYSLVTFSNVPYKVASEAGKVTEQILDQLCDGINDPTSLDRALAKNLIESRLSPILAPHESELRNLVEGRTSIASKAR